MTQQQWESRPGAEDMITEIPKKEPYCYICLSPLIKLKDNTYICEKCRTPFKLPND